MRSSDARSSVPMSCEATRLPRTNGRNWTDPPDFVSRFIAAGGKGEADASIVLAQDLAPEDSSTTPGHGQRKLGLRCEISEHRGCRSAVAWLRFGPVRR